MQVLGPTAETALRLASDGSKTPDQVVSELVPAGRPELERARDELVKRIHERSDDYEATGALGLVNKALATVGWDDPYNWKHRRKP